MVKLYIAQIYSIYILVYQWWMFIFNLKQDYDSSNYKSFFSDSINSSKNIYLLPDELIQETSIKNKLREA